MSESDWNRANISAMLGPLEMEIYNQDGVSRSRCRAAPLISNRKLRLLASACVRGWPSNDTAIISADAVDGETYTLLREAELAEEMADGGAIPPMRYSYVLHENAMTAVYETCLSDTVTRFNPADLLRCVGGYPFRKPPLRVECVNEQVLQLANQVYADRTADGMLDPISLAALADALEESGYPATESYNEEPRITVCGKDRVWRATWREGGKNVTLFESPRREKVLQWAEKTYRVKEWTSWISQAGKSPRSFWGIGVRPLTQPSTLLAHLRAPGPHCRGCWPVDLVLGKE